jgi:hypothetical protein
MKYNQIYFYQIREIKVLFIQNMDYDLCKME